MLLLTFRAAGQRYAVDAARVVEVVPRVRLRPLPHAPAHLAGVLEYRGEVVSVVDVGILLGGPAAAERLSTRIILVDRTPPAPARPRDGADARARAPSRRSLLGLVAENVDDLAPIDPDALTPSPVSIPDAPYLGGLVETGGGLVQFLLVDRILEATPRAGTASRD
ncbi:chemotaxis protein CheW [Paludisphaera mucosa]|uniref:Chemotaxis protein CheW n=1 Tax=Paludisphaera mucosa TaxID=3030827 RepID=A0ABT6FBG3_9BACT|nr:chemotaxis protein CheW [Paludisphaera mucosa]MDG3004881.1 chemotaxis protein CheW [Paludisphaera mucosa]